MHRWLLEPSLLLAMYGSTPIHPPETSAPLSQLRAGIPDPAGRARWQNIILGPCLIQLRKQVSRTTMLLLFRTIADPRPETVDIWIGGDPQTGRGQSLPEAFMTGAICPVLVGSDMADTSLCLEIQTFGRSYRTIHPLSVL